ncbi:4464_t:CDS:2, partial [Entrophospora sp. SA101]
GWMNKILFQGNGHVFYVKSALDAKKFDLTSNTLKEQQILLLKETNRYCGYEFIATATTTQLNQESTTTTTTQPTQEFIFH